MRVWSRGLGKQALSLDFAKSDVTREGNEVLIKGILRNGGVVWDCRVTFTKEDIAGLLHFALSFAMIRHFARNTTGFFTFIRDGLIMRRLGMKAKGGNQ